MTLRVYKVPTLCYLLFDTSVISLIFNENLNYNTDQEYHWNEVCLALKPLAADWKNVGQALGISKYKINEIAANNPTSVVNALSDVIQQWCGQNYKTDMFGHPSWHTLIRNLDADHKVGEDKVFLKEIAAKHKVCIHSSSLLHLSLSNTKDRY